MSKTFDVCIRGGGVVGHTLALLLARERLRVALVTRPQQAPAADVRAYALNSASREVLQALRVYPEGLIGRNFWGCVRQLLRGGPGSHEAGSSESKL